MKYILISLTTITVFTGSAFAEDATPNCDNLRANWINAPSKQCIPTFANSHDGIRAYKSIEVIVDVVEK
jgi:hypothetical protein